MPRRKDYYTSGSNFQESTIVTMTSINDIADLARILKEQPEWADTIRSLLLSEELLNLPAQFAEFVQLTQESNRITNERLGGLETIVGQLTTRTGSLETVAGQLATQMQRMETRMGRLEGRFSNFEGSDYERRIRTRALVRARDMLGLEDPYLALTQDGTIAPQLNSIIAQAIGGGTISREQSTDLYDSDLIISDHNNRHVVVEVSITASEDDVTRAKRRAAILRAASGGLATPVVITAILSEAQSSQAADEDVTTFIIPYP